MSRSSLLLFLCASAAAAQTPVEQAPNQVAWTELGPAPIESASYAGRISAVACSPTDSGRYFVAGADGGVWRTTDGGTSWEPLTDHMPTTSVGALALDPTDEDVLYAGTGEANYANHSRYGLGLYKSTDGGDSWVHLAEDVFGGRSFSRLLVDPANPQRVYAAVTRAGGFPELAAAKGHPGATGPLGVFRSDDGGVSWSHLPAGTSLPNLSTTDLAMDPETPAVLYAAVGRIFGGAQNGIYRSVNGGTSWTKLTGGLPASSEIGRISVATAPSQPGRVYALLTRPASSTGGSASTLGAWRSDDFGASWTSLPISSIQATYGWYLSVVGVHPTDADTVFFGGLELVRSQNAGASFTFVTPPHVDLHAVAFDAAGRVVVGDDGGVHRSENLGGSWSPLNDGIGTIQFYAGLSADPDDPLTYFGGTQDNGTNRRSSAGAGWTQVFGGDGGWTQVDPTDGDRVFCEFQGTGNLYASTSGGTFFSWSGSGIGFADRNCFLPPYLIDPSDPSRMLYGTHRVYLSTNGGASWTPLSDDVTTGTGAIRALAMSPADTDVVWAATNDGIVAVSVDGGASFQTVATGNPGWPRTTREITPHPTEPLTAWRAVADHRRPQVLRTTDGGQTWTRHDGNLPDTPVNVVEAIPGTPDVLFAGTDRGLYWSPDGGDGWFRYGRGLPNAPVIDILLDEERERITVGTQGRGAWEAPLVTLRKQ